MADPEEDFWPDYNKTITEDPAPVVLLKEQARLLGRKTGGRVEGVVREVPMGGGTTYFLNLRAPAIGDYEYKILDFHIPLTVGVMRPFPFQASDSDRTVQIANMENFKEWLKTTLSSESVANVIGNLSRRS